MAKITLITGGARSGKSKFAEMTAEKYADVCYIATATALDSEMRGRIERHKCDRPSHWRTIECSTDVSEVINVQKAGVFLLDCVTMLLTEIVCNSPISDLTRHDSGTSEKIENQCQIQIENLILSARNSKADVIIVTNELGMGIVPEHALGRLFRDIAGRANQRIAQAADEVFLLVAGIPIKVK